MPLTPGLDYAGTVEAVGPGVDGFAPGDEVLGAVGKMHLADGEDLFVVSRILGHASVQTTAGFYGHLQPAMLERSARRMDGLMRRAARAG